MKTPMAPPQEKARVVLDNLERLQRHYNNCILSHDRGWMLDLSHVLRLWTEMVPVLCEVSPSAARKKMFTNGLAPRPVRKLCRRAESVSCCFAGGVMSYATGGAIVAIPRDSASRILKCTIAAPAKERNGSRTFLTFFESASNGGSVNDKSFREQETQRLTYADWLGAECVRVSLRGENGEVDLLPLARSMLIKRVANVYNGSHIGDDEDKENRFDPAVRRLMDCSMGGLPLPYLILLKAAQDILEHVPRTLEEDGVIRKPSSPM